MCGHILGLIILLSPAFYPDIVSGQNVQAVNVEWLNFEQNGRQFLVLNAYARDQTSAKAAPLFLEIPLTAAPTSSDARAFLNALVYIEKPSQFTDAWRPRAVDDWTNLLEKLTTHEELWIYGRNIHSSEISHVLKDVYAAQGYPSKEDPVFPHLTRGVLTAVDSDGDAITSIDVSYDGDQSGGPLYQVVTFANLGIEPVKVYESSTLLDGYLTGAEFTLRPHEQKRRLLRLKSAVFSTLRGYSSASVKYVSEDRHFDALELRVRHSGLLQSFSGTLASVSGPHTNSWGEAIDYHIAFAFGGLLLALILVVSRAYAPAVISRVPLHLRSRRERLDISDKLTPSSVHEALHSSLHSLSQWKSEHVLRAVERTAQKARQRVASIEGIRPLRKRTAAKEVRDRVVSPHPVNHSPDVVDHSPDVPDQRTASESTPHEGDGATAEAIETTAEAKEATAETIETTADAKEATAETIETTADAKKATAEPIETTADAIGQESQDSHLSTEDSHSSNERKRSAFETIRESAYGMAAYLGRIRLPFNDFIHNARVRIGSIYRTRPSLDGLMRRMHSITATIGRIPPFVNRSASSARARATSFWHDILVPLRHRIEQTLTQLIADSKKNASIWKVQAEQLAINVYLYREFHSSPLTPKGAVQCIERIRQLTDELESSTSSRSSASERLRDEAACLARRLGSDLDHELLPPTTTNFQTLWALRMLADILSAPPDDLRDVMHSWLLGADHVLSHQGREGIGPTIPVFLKLMQGVR